MTTHSSSSLDIMLSEYFGKHDPSKMTRSESTYRREAGRQRQELQTALNKLRKTGALSSNDKQKIISAFEIAEYAHRGQLRTVGSMYISHPTKATIELINQSIRTLEKKQLEPPSDFYLIFSMGMLHDVPEELANKDRRTVTLDASAEVYADRALRAFGELANIQGNDMLKSSSMLNHLTRKEGQSYMSFLREPQKLPLDAAIYTYIDKNSDRTVNTRDVIAETRRKDYSQLSLLGRLIGGPYKNVCAHTATAELLNSNKDNPHPLKNLLIEGLHRMDLRTLAEAKSLRAAQQAGMRKGKSPREIALLEDQFAAVESDMVEYEGRPDFHMRTPVSYPSIFDGTLDLTQRISERFLGITVKDLSEESPYGIPYNKIDEALGMNKTQIEDKILATMEKQNVYGSRRKDVPGIRLNAAFTLYMMIAAHMKNHYQTFMMEGL